MRETIKINATNWKILYDKNISDATNTFGSCMARGQRINIDPEEGKEMQEETLLHEVLHSIFWQTGLGERFKNVTGINQEEVVSSITSTLYQVLKENYKIDFLK